MKMFLVLFFLFVFSASAEVGKVIKIAGENTGYLIRASEKMSLAQDLVLELQDEIHSDNSVLVLYLYPGTQMSLGKNTSVKITEHLIETNNESLQKSSSVIDLVKGIIRLQVSKAHDEEVNQRVTADDVAFGVRGTEFEVAFTNDSEVDLDVVEGEVEVTSPHVHTFVPEIVKANEGFKFDRKRRKFVRRKFHLKMKEHPGFQKTSDLRKKWRKLREKRKPLKKRVRNRQRKGAR